MPRLLCLLLLLAVAGGSATELTAEGLEGLGGKSLFAVFYAPWCGHCKALMPAWKAATEKLDADHVAMARLDCTAQENTALCGELQVQGYPTILYGGVDDLQPYEGGRDEESLLAFARSLKPVCGVGNEEHCGEEDAERLKALAALDAAALRAKIEEHQETVKEVEAGYKAEVETLQKRYAEITDGKKKKLETLRAEARIGLVKSALRAAGGR